MSKVEARQCDNRDCGKIVPKKQVSRVKIEIEGQPLAEPIGVSKEMCPDCIEEYVHELTTGNGWTPVRRRRHSASAEQSETVSTQG